MQITDRTLAIGKDKDELVVEIMKLVNEGRDTIGYPDCAGASKDEVRWVQAMVKYEDENLTEKK